MPFMVPCPRHSRPRFAPPFGRAVAAAPRAALRAVLAVALLGAASAAVGPPVAAAGSPAPARIVFLGDSLTAGYGLPGDEAFPALLERRLRADGLAVDVVNAGVSGDTSAGGLSRLGWVLKSKPVLVVVELGANDALRGQPLKATEDNLRAIVGGIRKAGAGVVLLGMDVPTSYGPDYAGGFAAIYPRVAQELDVTLVPGFIREVGLDPSLMQADGLHPTAEGHRRLAALLEPVLRRALERRGVAVSPSSSSSTPVPASAPARVPSSR